jgi:hypothetical protein
MKERGKESNTRKRTQGLVLMTVGRNAHSTVYT